MQINNLAETGLFSVSIRNICLPLLYTTHFFPDYLHEKPVHVSMNAWLAFFFYGEKTI